VVQPAPEAPARPSPSVKAEGARSIQSELELIRGAQKHLHRGDARAALTLLAEHARRFPSGALTEEREASRVFALCQLGDVSGARAQAERFVRRSPSSPFAERVRSSCRSGAR
jgi:outer membrane protein assembly factor BamD (BamD/ComL family)